MQKIILLKLQMIKIKIREIKKIEGIDVVNNFILLIIIELLLIIH